LILLSSEPAVLAYHLGELTVSANPGKLRRQPGAGTTPVVRNLPSSFIKVTSLGARASSAGIPPQGASSASKPVDWESVVLAYHHKELVFQQTC
jgi:hypothetical protein